MPRKRAITFGQAIHELGSTSAAQLLGRRGGKVTSQAKAEAARENGKRGGRPKLKPK